MVYRKDFFDLQLQFAHKVAEISGLSFARTLMDYTNLYVRFGLGREFNPDHPVWQSYLSGLQESSDRAEWTYRFYLTRTEVMAWPPVVAAFGAFSYGLLSGERIPTPLPEYRHGGRLFAQPRLRGQAACGVNRSLRSSAADPAGAGPDNRSIVAVQSAGLPSPLSCRIHHDGAPGA